MKCVGRQYCDKFCSNYMYHTHFILHASLWSRHCHITVASWHINSSITMRFSSRRGKSVLPVDMWKHRDYDVCKSIGKATTAICGFATQCQEQACKLKHGTEGKCPVEFHKRSWEHNRKEGTKKTQINWEYRCIIVCIVRKGYICGRGKNCFWNQVLSSNLKGHCRNWYTSRGTPKYKFTDPPAATAHVSLEHPSLQEMDQRSNFFVIFARTPRVAPETASLTASPKASHNEAAKWRQTV